MSKSKLIVSSSVSLGVLGAFTLTSCKDSKKVAEENGEVVEVVIEEVEPANPKVAEVVEEVIEVQENLKTAPVTAADLTEEAGFAQYLPKETEIFFNFRNLADIIESLVDSDTISFLTDTAKAQGEDFDQVLESPQFGEAMNVVGEEMFFSIGEGTGELIKTTGDMYAAYYQGYYRIIAEMSLKTYESGDVLSAMNDLPEMMSGLMKPMMDEMLKMDNYKMPTTYVGIKVSDPEVRKNYLQLIKGALKNASSINEMLPGMEIPFEDVSSELYGGFDGVNIDNTKWMQQMKNSPQNAELYKMMGWDDEYMEKYMEKFKDLKFTLLAGEYNGYIVIYLGNGVEGLKFAEDSNTSLISHQGMSFLKEYNDKNVSSISYISKDISAGYRGVSTYMEDFAGGVNQVLAKTDVLGDTKHIQDLITKMAKNSRVSKELAPPARFGSVGYVEDGYKIDSFHGSKSALFDMNAKRKLAGIAMRDEAAFSASWVNNAERSALVIEGIEDFVNLTYQVTKMVVEFDTEIDNRDFQEFAGMFRMLDGQFSNELTALWKSVKTGLTEGMGDEVAMVIDLEGKMPRIPSVPTVVLENGKIPRFAIGRDVVSREKMAESWKGIDTANKNIIAKIEQLANQKINYLSPELAKREGIDIWSYQLGITSRESNLALGINDKMAFVTSSPAMVESFVTDYEAAGKGPGMDIKMRFDPMRSLARDWRALVDEHGEAMGTEFDREKFNKSKPMINKFLKASEEVESMDYSIREVKGEVRSFFHFNARD